MGLQYKIVELSVVTDQTLEDTVNKWVGQDWVWDGVRFAMSDASRRPAMAFLSFTRESNSNEADEE